jgi:hypothetical protein
LPKSAQSAFRDRRPAQKRGRDERNRTLADQEVVAAILSAVLCAHQKTGASDITEAVKTYHACLDAMKRFGETPAEERWTAASERLRMVEESGQKT